ncbi:hypothetical protein PMZ80_010341 [Knufia obscura]|uniref:Uncharacterized protein n=2 Tax=Knufia TaxID=430999 RepID=A0AAN8EHT2_9EURO|nr:hypothetical protein PMZ80_010341 [Knufia obscura]KAK5951848.1 hypothetical protein OHC33_007140 [Knufia fluminis]
MHTLSFLLLSTLLALTTAELPKANEYRDGDCSELNYGHHASNLIDVTMDDTSNSVYLAGAQWLAFSEKTGDGGSCYGDVLPAVVAGCNNLDRERRIWCVRNTSNTK